MPISNTWSTTLSLPRWALKMHPYTLIQLGMHSNASDGGVDRYFWGLNQGFAQVAADLKTQRFFFQKGSSAQESLERRALGSADLPLRKRLFLLRKRILGSPQFDPRRSVLASHFALYAAALLGRKSELTHVIHFHGPWAQESLLQQQNGLQTLVKKGVEHLVYRTADAFITLSNAFRDLLISNYGVAPSKVHVIPGAVDTSWFKPAERTRARASLGWPQGERIIFCVRRLVQRMGLEALVAGFALAAEKERGVRLFIGGKGPLQSALEAQIRSLGLGERIRMLGFISESLLPAHYQAADLSIVPSETLEGFGLTTLESLACGTPVLVTPVGGLTEVVGPLAPGCILHGFSSRQIAQGLEAYLGARLPLPEPGQCVAYVKEHFLWERVSNHVLNIYDEAFLAKHAELKTRPEARGLAT
jgi:glycosyltransferase involved in cell wall biosynthesis